MAEQDWEIYRRLYRPPRGDGWPLVLIFVLLSLSVLVAWLVGWRLL